MEKLLKADAGIPGWLIAVFAVVAGVSVANIYYIQPLLNLVKLELGLNDFQVSLISLCNQGGYAIGLFLIIPLGDLLQRKGIILVNLGIAVAAALAISFAQSVALVALACLVLGACSVTPQLLIPLAAQCSRPPDKAKNMGIVLTGLLTGIIGSRVLSGVFGQVLGWRHVYLIVSALMLACVLLIALTLPRVERGFAGGYRQLMASLFALPRRFPILVSHALRYAFCFGSLLAMWTSLTFKLGGAPFYAPAGIIGLLGLCGVAGALTSSVIGRWVQRLGQRRFNLIGVILIMSAWLCLLLGQDGYSGIIAGIVLIDVGMQFIQLGNQTAAFALAPDAVNRVNTIYMTIGFIGGALGTFCSGAAWHLIGWDGVVLVGLILAWVALILTLASRK